jgi:tetratricopeptide (TPR) repeat protein
MLFAYQKRPADAEAALRPAVKAFKKLEELQAQGNDPDGRVADMLNTPESKIVDKIMGEVLADQGKNNEAVRHLLRADAIAKAAVQAASDPAALGTRLKGLEKLGLCYLSLAQDHLARPCFEQGVEIAQRTGNKQQLQMLQQYLHQCQQ